MKVDDFMSTLEPDDWLFTYTADGSGAAQEACRRAVQAAQAKLVDALRVLCAEMEEMQAAEQTPPPQ